MQRATVQRKQTPHHHHECHDLIRLQHFSNWCERDNADSVSGALLIGFFHFLKAITKTLYVPVGICCEINFKLLAYVCMQAGDIYAVIVT